MPLALRQWVREGQDSSRCVYVGEDPEHASVDGVEVVSQSWFLQMPGRKFFNVAIAESKMRQQVAGVFRAAGCEPRSIIAETARILGRNVNVAEGAIICDYAVLTADIRIGAFFQANLFSYVAHDCEIGDFVTFAPRVSCNGRVRIGDHAYLGTGATLRHGTSSAYLEVGAEAVVGMGSNVLEDVPPGSTVVGNPARQRSLNPGDSGGPA